MKNLRFRIKFWHFTSYGKVNVAKFQKRLRRLDSSVKMHACNNFWANRTYGIHFTDQTVRKSQISITIWPLTSPGKVNSEKFRKHLRRLVSSVNMKVCTNFWANQTYVRDALYVPNSPKISDFYQNLNFDLSWKGQFCEISKTPLQACF